MKTNHTKLALTAIFGLALAFTFSCGDNNLDDRLNSSSGASSSNTKLPIYGEPITDTRDGKTYKTVVIGGQIWMAENLKFNASGSKCGNGRNLVDMNTYTCDIYGRLYNWATAMEACPTNWHVPSNAEWTTLMYFVGANAGIKLKSTSGWDSNGNGTDDYGFSALPGGYGSSSVGGFLGEGNCGRWWSANTTESNAENAHYRGIEITESNVNSYSIPKSYLHSVRCIYDYSPSSSSNKPQPSSSSESSSVSVSSGSNSGCTASNNTKTHYCSNGTMKQYGSVTDDKGRTYKTVEINYSEEYQAILGNTAPQVWMAENLNYNASGSICYDYMESNCGKYGRLYNWATAMALDSSCNSKDCAQLIDAKKHRGICPSNWHIPTKAEWNTLFSMIGGTKGGANLRTTSGWDWNSIENISGNGTDAYGFAALPGGYGDSDGNFNYAGDTGYWWGNNGSGGNCFSMIMNTSISIFLADGGVRTVFNSVRCIKD